MNPLAQAQTGFEESLFEEVFHILGAVAALFGYPPPPPPQKLRNKPEWSHYVTTMRFDKSQIPYTEFYGNSPYETNMVRDEALRALRILKKHIRACERQKDNVGKAGLQYLSETIRLYLAKVGEIVEEENFWLQFPIIRGIVRKRMEKKKAWEKALKRADLKRRGLSEDQTESKTARPTFFRANDKQLRVIYHTLRSYVLDENVSFAARGQAEVGRERFVKYNVQKTTESSADDAFLLNKWLGMFFTDLFKEK